MRHFRRVIRIVAEQSPNVRLALAQIAAGIEPTNEILIPGVLPYADYVKRRATWDPIRQTIGLDAQFYKGAEILLYPPNWLNRAHRLHELLRGKSRQAKAIGIDPAEGGDKTSMAAIDELGLIEGVSKKTPDTTVVVSEAIAFMRKHNVPPDKVVLDRGGGGKEHADRLRKMGYPVRTVSFGESLLLDFKRGIRLMEERLINREERYTYVNRRAEMYGDFSMLLDPGPVDEEGYYTAQSFALPGEIHGDFYAELRRQLSPIPKLYDQEGRLYMLPKNKPAKDTAKQRLSFEPGSEDQQTLVGLLGHSPDEADSVVLGIFAMTHKPLRSVAGAVR